MTHMTQLRFGTAGTSGVDSSGRAPIETSAFDPSIIGYGVPMAPMRALQFVPLTLGAANIAASQTPAAAGSITLTAGTGVVAATLNKGGNVVNVLDITQSALFDRSVTITGVSATTAQTFTITGYDMYGQLQTSTITGPVGATTVETTKCYRYIQSITVAAGTVGAITVGTGDTYGLPLAVLTFDQFIGLYWNNAAITATTGFTAADATSPATSATGHPRGTYKVQSASNGTKQLSAYIHVPLASLNNMNLAYGVVPA